MSWLRGYGSPRQPQAPPPKPAQQSDAPTARVPLVCPKCFSDSLRVRSSSRIKVRLQCLECQHEWFRGGEVKRVFIGK